jgi:hypothetical protein
MRWVRSAFGLLASVSVLACTRDNPAFEDGGDELLDEGDTRPGTDDGEIETETGTVAECEYDEGHGVTIELPMPCGETNEQTQRYDRSFLVISATANGWLGGLCEVGDLDCTGDCPINVPQAIEIGGFDVSGLVGATACLRISAEQADPASESCSFDAIGIWSSGKPIVVASNGSVVIAEALSDAGEIAPMPEPVENPPCECTDACCESSPGDYRFDIGGQKIAVGDPVDLDAYAYEFHPLRAYNPTGCADDLQQAWGLTYSP